MQTTSILFLLCILGIILAQEASTVRIWPHPQQFSSSFQTVCVEPNVGLQFQITNKYDNANECVGVLKRAMDRYGKLLVQQPPFLPANPKVATRTIHAALESSKANVISVNVDVTTIDACAYAAMDEMDESYTLNMAPDTNAIKINIKSASIFGALRALETMSQRFVAQLAKVNSDGTIAWQFCASDLPLTVQDKPRYKWRGLLVDTARHYLPIATLQKILDAMEADKFNVMHWHMVDAQSFPMEVAGISQPFDSAYQTTYSTQQLKDLVSYARDRGIRVVPEIDMPGHAASWYVFGQNVTAWCPNYFGNINNIPLNPILDTTYAVVKKVMDYVKGIFPDKYVHIGADELVKACWRADTTIANFIANNPYGIKNADDLWAYFQNRMFNENFKNSGKTIVAWEEIAIHLNSSLYSYDASSGIVQVWSDPVYWRQVLEKGYRAIYSAPYYLDKQKPYESAKNRWLWVDVWQDMYVMDPLTLAAGVPNAENLVLGGEACQWGEQVDQASIFERIWPRASAVAERLWSSPSINNTNLAQTRLIHHRCYDLVKRGIRATPIRPDFCPYVFGLNEPEMQPPGGNSPALIAFSVVVSILCLGMFIALITVIIYYRKRISESKSYQTFKE